MTEPNADQFFLELADMSRKLLVLADDNAAMLQTPEQKAMLIGFNARLRNLFESMNASESVKKVIATVVFATALGATLKLVSAEGLAINEMLEPKEP